VDEADSGIEAVAAVERRVPDLLLLDIIMPDLDGCQVLERIRERYASDRLPVVFLSAQDPSDGPLASPVLVAAVDRGIPMHNLLPGTPTSPHLTA
jgi:two-component system cell cycle response regulator